MSCASSGSQYCDASLVNLKRQEIKLAQGEVWEQTGPEIVNPNVK